MEKVVIVNSGKEAIIKKYGVKALSTYKDLNFIGCLLRSLMIRINSTWIRYFYTKTWLEELRDYDTIVVFDGMNVLGDCKKISERYPQKRLILFYWNIIKGNVLNKLPKQWEVWTSDYGDAQKYGIMYNGQFVYDAFFENVDTTPKYDLYFVGINKGRFVSLNKLKELLSNNYHLNVFFRFVNPIRALINHRFSKPIPYQQVVEETGHSRIVLEYNQAGQEGLTLRCIESLILQKKLITNNKDVVNYKFYNPHNIYILKDDNVNDLQDFIDADFVPYDKDVIYDHSFTGWLKRIVEGKALLDR